MFFLAALRFHLVRSSYNLLGIRPLTRPGLVVFNEHGLEAHTRFCLPDVHYNYVEAGANLGALSELRCLFMRKLKNLRYGSNVEKARCSIACEGRASDHKAFFGYYLVEVPACGSSWNRFFQDENEIDFFDENER